MHAGHAQRNSGVNITNHVVVGCCFSFCVLPAAAERGRERRGKRKPARLSACCVVVFVVRCSELFIIFIFYCYFSVVVASDKIIPIHTSIYYIYVLQKTSEKNEIQDVLIYR